MEISPIGPGTKFFSHSVEKARFKSRKDRLLINQLMPKDRITISPEARIPISRKPAHLDREPLPPAHEPIHPYPGIGLPSIRQGNDFTIPEDILESIEQGIADKLSVPVENITIVEQKQVFWSDTSMGNPQPGHFYAQVLVPGYKITAQVGEDKQTSEFYAVLDPGGEQLQDIVGPDPLSEVTMSE